MRLGIYTNIYKDKDLAITKKLSELFFAARIECFIHESLAEFAPKAKFFSEKTPMPLDLIVTIGGDGTILRIAKWCALNNIPILGINSGNVGFLTEVELGDFSQLVKAVAEKNYQLETRTLLRAVVAGENFYALNEFVLSRNNIAKMIVLDVGINGQRVDSYYCDGFIVSTPTGSTAYSLSAGGSVISPNTAALALTPINSHSLHGRPIVVSDNEVIELTLGNKTQNASVMVDGKVCGEVKCGEKLRIEKADIRATFVRFGKSNFYSRLLEKLNKWSITGQ